MRMMRHLCSPTFAIVLLALLGLATPLAAQMYPGDDVTVNLNAIPGAVQPGQPYSAIHLRPPSAHHRHRKIARARVPVDTAPTDTATTETSASTDNTPPAAQTASPAKTRHHSHADETATTDTAAPATNPIPFSFGGDTSMPAPEAAPAAKVAKTEAPSARKNAATNGGGPLAKRGAILFEHNATDPTPSQLEPIKLLAGDLNSAIEAGATRIQLQAFGGAPGDKSSDARRISLKRALAIRQILIDNGVPADRIDVRAMGGVTDKGEPDRVDVYVKAS